MGCARGAAGTRLIVDETPITPDDPDIPDAPPGPGGGEPEIHDQPLGVPAQQVEHVLGGADRTLDAAQRVAVEQLDDALVGQDQLVGRRGEPLAQGGDLGGDVVRATGHGQVRVLRRQPAQPDQGRDDAVPNDAERGPDLELLDVLREVA